MGKYIHLTGEGLVAVVSTFVLYRYLSHNAAILFIWATFIGIWLDRWLGDPSWLPHPIVGYGHLISFFEHRLNQGTNRYLKGGITVLALITGVSCLIGVCVQTLASFPFALGLFATTLLFTMLAGKTLIVEVVAVFKALDQSLENGRKQVQRIVGRDTANLQPQEIRLAALETLAENLSDGVIAPLWWYFAGMWITLIFVGPYSVWPYFSGLVFICTYKMINTLDSMIGYKNERYRQFGFVAAHLDDIANYIPARLTAVCMIMVSGKWHLFPFVRKYGRAHLSPNSGYPEAALAGILDCRFGGPHDYFGEEVYKPYIGMHNREVHSQDVQTAVNINRFVESVVLIGGILISTLLILWLS